ncbi:MAG: hypothetical protein AAFZ38_06550, partial [Myxococcota bacterium]
RSTLDSGTGVDEHQPTSCGNVVGFAERFVLAAKHVGPLKKELDFSLGDHAAVHKIDEPTADRSVLVLVQHACAVALGENLHIGFDFVQAHFTAADKRFFDAHPIVIGRIRICDGTDEFLEARGIDKVGAVHRPTILQNFEHGN